MKRIYSLLVLCLFALATVQAQISADTVRTKAKAGFFNHLDAGLTVGSTGVGLELSMPVGDYFRIRGGVDYMPKIEVPMHLGIKAYSGTSESTIDKAAELLETFSGYKVGDEVEMIGKPDMLQFRLLVDIFPLKNNKDWYLTLGVYYGNSTVGTAVNDINNMTTLVSVGMYNSMYDYFVGGEYWDEPLYGDFYIDPEMGQTLEEKFGKIGKMGAGLGKFKQTMYYYPATNTYSTAKPKTGEEGVDYLVYNKGDRYVLKPNRENATVSADAKVNRWRPYVGLGYNTHIDKQERLSIGFDCGVLFWGGAPDVITHEGVDLMNHVEKVPGKVGDYIDIANKFKAYPVLNFRVAYNIF